jgi:hypothetical protein
VNISGPSSTDLLNSALLGYSLTHVRAVPSFVRKVMGLSRQRVARLKADRCLFTLVKPLG